MTQPDSEIETELSCARDGTLATVHAGESTFLAFSKDDVQHRFPALLELLGELPQLTNISIMRAGLTDDHIAKLAPVLDTMPNLERLDFDGNEIGDAGIADLMPVIASKPNFFSFILGNNENITSDCVATIVQHLPDMPQIAQFEISEQCISAEAGQSISDTLLAMNPRNLWHGGSTEELREFQDQNRKRLGKLADSFLGHDNPSKIPSHELWEIDRCRLGIRNIRGNNPEKWAEFDAYLAGIPSVAIGDVSAPEDLFAKAENGSCPLDHKDMWEHFPAICEKLAAQGTPLTLEHLQEWGRTARSHLRNAIALAPMEQLMPGLEASGIQIQKDLLLDDEGYPTFLLEDLMSRGKVKGLFCYENWSGASIVDVKEVTSQLRDDQKPDNFNALSVQLSRDARSLARSR